jgi:Flp pilus assembly pilin Flp
MRSIFSYKSQSLIEVALLIGIVGLAIVGMEVYIRRGVQAKVKNLTDYIVSDEQAPDEDAADTQSSTSLETTVTTTEYMGGSKNSRSNESSTYTYSK